MSRVIWSDGKEFITVIYRDGRIVEGYSDDTKWDSEIHSMIERLKAAGCHGFDDDRSGGLTSLYLNISTYVAVTSPGPWSKEYAAWAKKERTPDGFRCIDLDGGWYLTVKKN